MYGGDYCLDLLQYSTIFKALGDETRLKIIELLSSEEELCACRILENFNITQPTLSYHMKLLTESKIVVGKKKGAWIYYSLDRKQIKNLEKFFSCKCKE